MARNKVQGYLTRNEIRVSILLGIEFTVRFYLVAAYSFESSRSVECRVLTSQPTPARVCGGKSLCKKILIMCRQWRFQHSGSTWAFDYALYCRTRACMLCMFVLPPTSLIKVVNSGSFHWALSVFIYFRFMLAFRLQFAGDVNQKISFKTTALLNTFACSLLGLIHWRPSCPL